MPREFQTQLLCKSERLHINASCRPNVLLVWASGTLKSWLGLQKSFSQKGFCFITFRVFRNLRRVKGGYLDCWGSCVCFFFGLSSDTVWQCVAAAQRCGLLSMLVNSSPSFSRSRCSNTLEHNFHARMTAWLWQHRLCLKLKLDETGRFQTLTKLKQNQTRSECNLSPKRTHEGIRHKGHIVCFKQTQSLHLQSFGRAQCLRCINVPKSS